MQAPKNLDDLVEVTINLKDINSCMAILDCGDSRERHEAVVALEAIGTLHAIAGLQRACVVPDFPVRLAAVSALERLSTEPAVQALTDIALTNDIIVKERAIKALGRIGSELALNALDGLSNHQRDIELQRLAIQTLAENGTPEAIRILAGVCLFDDCDRPTLVVRALERVTNGEAIETLLKCLVDIEAPQIFQMFIAAMTSRSPKLREKVASILDQNPNTQAIAVFVEVLNQDDLSAKLKVIALLARHQEAAAAAGLAAALTDPDFNVRRGAAQALTGQGILSIKEIQRLADALFREHFDFGETARSLARPTSSPEVRNLSSVFANKDPEQIRQAVNAILSLTQAERRELVRDQNNCED